MATPSEFGARSALRVTVREDLPGQLFFYTREDWIGDVPEDQGQLRVSLDDACAVIRARFKDDGAFAPEFRRLLALAHAAFSQNYAQVKQGVISLDAYKEELVRREGASIKNQYLKELLISAVLANLLILAVAFGGRYAYSLAHAGGLVADQVVGQTSVKTLASVIRWDDKYSAMHFALLLAACMWGIWTSFAVRNMKLEFSQLQHLELDMMRPWARLLTYGLLALILALFFQMGVLVISIGGVSTSQISDNALVAVFVGLCLGFTDKALPGEVRRRIEEFFQSARKGNG